MDRKAALTTSTSTTVAMTLADTQYSFVWLAGQTRTLLGLLDTTKSWRWSWTAGVVAGGGGTPVGAGFQVEEESGHLVGQTLYFACGSAGQTMEVSYEKPAASGST